MSSRSEELPGLRKPTQEERRRIEQSWCPVIQKYHKPNEGKLTKYLGVFLICVSCANLSRGGSATGEALLTFALAMGCIFFSVVARKNFRRKTVRLERLKAGDYLVAQVYSDKTVFSTEDQEANAMVNAYLPDGQPLKGYYRVPADCVEYLMKQKGKRVPVLLIQIFEDPEVLAIPVK